MNKICARSLSLCMRSTSCFSVRAFLIKSVMRSWSFFLVMHLMTMTMTKKMTTYAFFSFLVKLVMQQLGHALWSYNMSHVSNFTNLHSLLDINTFILFGMYQSIAVWLLYILIYYMSAKTAIIIIDFGIIPRYCQS